MTNCNNVFNDYETNIIKKYQKIYPPFVPTPKSNKHFSDLTGQVFGKLKVLYRCENLRKWKATWVCLCSCMENSVIRVTADNLLSGNTNSCGCYGKEQTSMASKKFNGYDMKTYDYGIGFTYNNGYFLFDKEDYDKIKNYCWHISADNYVEARNSDGKLIKMRRLIMDVLDEPAFEVDHVYHNPDGSGREFDNRKFNLRVSTHAENMCNHKLNSRSTSGFSGIRQDKRNGKYIARITKNGKEYHLGVFDNIECAINCRLNAEKEFFQEFQYKELKET